MYIKNKKTIMSVKYVVVVPGDSEKMFLKFFVWLSLLYNASYKCDEMLLSIRGDFEV